jgi:hypothetical protein
LSSNDSSEPIRPILSTHGNNHDESLVSTVQPVSSVNSVIISEPFVTVKHRRRSMKERRQETYHTQSLTNRFPVNQLSNSNEKRRFASTSDQHETKHSSVRTNVSTYKPNPSCVTKEELYSNDEKNFKPLEIISSQLPTVLTQSQTGSIEQVQASPRLSSHSSTSSLSSLLKRPSKVPPVVFLNKSGNIELNDVSFGFDIDSFPICQPSNETMSHSSSMSTIEKESNKEHAQTSSSVEHQSSEDMSTVILPSNSLEHPQFYSGSDIRPHQRTYASQAMSAASSYVDPVLLLQYNQQQYANYPQHLSCMHFPSPQYLSSQPQYVFVPNPYSNMSNHEDTSNRKSFDEQTVRSSDHVQESSMIYTTVPNDSNHMYIHPTTTKSSFIDTKQPYLSNSNMYTTASAMYPSAMFYSRPSHVHPSMFPPSTAYFQPISSSSSLVDVKPDEHDIHHDNYQQDTTVQSYHSTGQLPSTSSDIMSNALQLVYSQQRRNAQTDRFNLDDLTAYLAMKWTETVDHYEQGITFENK